MYNKLLRAKVKDLEIKNAVTTISTDLTLGKGTLSSYLSGSIKVSKKFLEKFCNYYNVPIKDLLDDLKSDDEQIFTDESVNHITDKAAVDHIIEHKDRLLQTNPAFKMFIENFTVKAEVEMWRKLKAN